MDKVKTVAVRLGVIHKINMADNVTLTNDYYELVDEGHTLTYLKIIVDNTLFEPNINQGSAFVLINDEECGLLINTDFELDNVEDRLEIKSLKINKNFQGGMITMIERGEY